MGDYFSAKLQPHHSKWYPCEIEALSIAASVRHFGLYLRQSQKLTQILTDNKPCVQAWSRMIRGEFSTSSLAATFMSALAEYHVDVQHIQGALNLPSDFHSHNPPSCNSPDCQVCQFIADSESSVVCKTTIADAPFLPSRELIVVPQRVLPGILTSLHLYFNHPSIRQLQKIFNRAFFALNVDAAISAAFSLFTHCQSLLTLPKELHLQSTSAPAACPSIDFACDIMRRYKQFVFVLWNTFSPFTSTILIPNERSVSLRTALLSIASAQRASPQTPVLVRVDNAPGFKSLRRAKNVNRNPVAETAIRELGSEILRFNLVVLTDETFALITSQLNSRICSCGLSAWEIAHQRDQCSGLQLPFMMSSLLILNLLSVKQTMFLVLSISSWRSSSKPSSCTSGPFSLHQSRGRQN